MGLFDWFSKREELPPIDFSSVQVDIHSHLIPGIDDGSQTLEESLELLRQFSAFGYRKVVTTPHIMGDYYQNTPEIILSGLEELQRAKKKEGIEIEIEAAAEYYLDFDFQQKIESGNLLTIGANFVLFELPFISEPAIFSEIIFQLQTAGYKPILAHPERYSFWHQNFEKYQQVRDKGVRLQLNVNSLSGAYSPQVRKIAHRLIDEELIDFVGSDCHNMSHIETMKTLQRDEYLHKILRQDNLLNRTL